MNQASPRSARVLRALPAAMGWGAFAALVLPVMLALGALAVGHLAGACGSGSSGGCEMGAASLAIVAVVPCFVIGAAFGLWRGLRG